jgi:CSLREA domain-containing protein
MNRAEFRLNRKALFGVIVLAAAGAMPVHAATIAVTSFADAVADDGVCSLREAVIAANTNTATGGCAAGESVVADVINLPAGTYTLSISGSDEVEDASTVGVLDMLNTPNPAIGDLDIIESVTITGAGSATTAIDAAGIDRIFHVNATAGTIDVAISGVKLTQGHTTQVDLGVGPVSGSGPLPTNYYLRRAGGALAVGPAAAVVLVDPNVTGQANSEGRGGSQKPTEPDEGGATFSLRLDDVVVDGNHADGDGGGIYTAAAMAATGVVVSNNNALTNGGGIYNEGNTTITNTTITENSAEGGGGIFMTGSNTVSISGTTLSFNQAIGGGGISGRSGMTLNLVNSTLSGNIGSDVGAGLYTNGSANLNFVTIANNLAGADSPTAGSGINVFPASTTANTVSLRNVLLSGNKAAWLEGMDTAAIAALPSANCGMTGGGVPVATLGGNLSSDTTCEMWLMTASLTSLDFNNVDPKLAALADNGGPTYTHALAADSPALGRGLTDPAVTADQRGVARQTPPDIGAFELVTADPAPLSGGGGGGCAVGGSGHLDPTLPAMLAAALAFLGWRRRALK